MLLKTGGSALMLAFVVGCTGGRASSSSPVPAPLSIAALAGEYALVAVDGQPLPYAPRARGAAAVTSVLPVVSGSFLINPDGTFRLQTIYDQSEAATISAPAFRGTCYTEGSEVKMAWDGGGLTDVSVRGDTVMLKREGALYAYLRSRGR